MSEGREGGRRQQSNQSDYIQHYLNPYLNLMTCYYSLLNSISRSNLIKRVTTNGQFSFMIIIIVIIIIMIIVMSAGAKRFFRLFYSILHSCRLFYTCGFVVWLLFIHCSFFCSLQRRKRGEISSAYCCIGSLVVSWRRVFKEKTMMKKMRCEESKSKQVFGYWLLKWCWHLCLLL